MVPVKILRRKGPARTRLIGFSGIYRLYDRRSHRPRRADRGMALHEFY